MQILILILLASCGAPNKGVSTSSPLDEVKAKRDLYIELAKEEVDEYGWLSPRCDGLLFNSLAAFSGFPVDPLLSEISPGEWERHPSKCFRNGSKSSISRDMFRGLLLWLYSEKKLDKIREIKDYCDNHQVAGGLGCAMGEAVDEESYWGRVVMTPGMRWQINRALKISSPVSSAKGDFEAHLDALRIFLDYKIDGGLSNADVKTLENYADNSPRNALYRILANKFTSSDQSQAISILLDEKLFPSNRLPTDSDHYTHYLWQRDDNEDWLPCGSSDKRPCEGVTHSGIDFIFAVKLLEE